MKQKHKPVVLTQTWLQFGLEPFV